MPEEPKGNLVGKCKWCGDGSGDWYHTNCAEQMLVSNTQEINRVLNQCQETLTICERERNFFKSVSEVLLEIVKSKEKEI